MTSPIFATFWKGALAPLEQACLASAIRRGYQLILYSYEPLAGVPTGVERRDAREVVPESALNSFMYGGKPNLSHFSDLFRYKLFERTGAIWVDADILFIREINIELPATVLAREWQPSICGAVMRIDRRDHRLSTLIRETEAAMGRDLLWGETGPLLLTRVFGRAVLMKEAFPAERFFAIDHDDFWKVLLPDYAEECRTRTNTSWGVHLWNNIVDTLGYWKVLAPPEGSFLHTMLAADDSLRLFTATYPLPVMQSMIDNYRLRKSGGDLGIRQLSTQVLPSVFRTIRHYRR